MDIAGESFLLFDSSGISLLTSLDSTSSSLSSSRSSSVRDLFATSNAWLKDASVKDGIFAGVEVTTEEAAAATGVGTDNTNLAVAEKAAGGVADG